MKKIILFSIIFTLFCACKKYPEDPKSSKQSPARRLMKHTWILQNLMIDGQDSTAQFFQNSPYCCTIEYSGSGETIFIAGHGYKFAFNRNQDIEIASGGGPTTTVFVHPKVLQGTTMQIRELYGHTFKFNVVHPDNGKVYVFLYTY